MTSATFVSSLLVFSLSMVAISASVSEQYSRILTNAETGTITHPLIPHAAHLTRRRRELYQKYGEDFDTTLPPRPHASRHSLPTSFNSNNNNEVPEEIKTLLRATNNNRRHLQQQMGALYQGYGTHYIDLWVGTPTPQRQTVIVDTGSGVTAFPCEECKGCGDMYHTDTYFQESKSKTFRSLSCDECMKGYCASMDGERKCRISMSYAEGSSWSAYEGMDLCYAGGLHDAPLGQKENDGLNVDHIDPVDASQFAFELAFGCQVSITGLFITQLADGIMGMENEKTSFWKQMHSKNVIPKPEFSLCFSRQDNAEREGTGAGAMTLGGVDPRLHTSPMVFAKNMKSSGFYAVHLKAVYLREGGGLSAQVTANDMSKMHKLDISESSLNSGNVIVDSGTTDTYMTRALETPFKNIWKQLTGTDYSHAAVSLTLDEIMALPTIIIVMTGHDGGVGDETSADPNDVPGYAGDALGAGSPKDIVLAIPASHYLEFDPDAEKYVPRFYTEESSGSVLGANAMMGHDVYFDTANERVGFAESECDYAALLSLEGKSISVAPQSVSTKTEVPEEVPAEVPSTVAPTEPVAGGPAETPAEEPAADYDDNEYYDDDDESDANNDPYELFPGTNNNQTQGGGSKYSVMANNILEDMKHECSSSGCRGIAAFLILSAALVVTIMIRRTVARRRVIRQYQEAELEISDLALDSDSDDEGGYVDEPPLPQIS